MILFADNSKVIYKKETDINKRLKFIIEWLKYNNLYKNLNITNNEL